MSDEKVASSYVITEETEIKVEVQNEGKEKSEVQNNTQIEDEILENSGTNVLVVGTQRTGTSLMMEMLGTDPNLTIFREDMDFEEEEFYTGLQPFYNESELVSGINEKNLEKFKKLKNNCLKIMNDGVFITHEKYLKSFKKIIVMTRNWRNNSISVRNLIRKNVDYKLKKFPVFKQNVEAVSNRDEFVKDNELLPGVVFGYSYGKLIIDSINRNYIDKLVIVNFDDLIDKTFNTIILLKEFDINISKGTNLIDDGINQNRKLSKEDLKYIEENELKEGFYEYLDKLYINLNTGKLEHSFLLEVEKWTNEIYAYIQKTHRLINRKYNVSM